MDRCHLDDNRAKGKFQNNIWLCLVRQSQKLSNIMNTDLQCTGSLKFGSWHLCKLSKLLLCREDNWRLKDHPPPLRLRPSSRRLTLSQTISGGIIKKVTQSKTAIINKFYFRSWYGFNQSLVLIWPGNTSLWESEKRSAEKRLDVYTL